MSDVSAIGSGSDIGMVQSMVGSKAMGKEEFLKLLVAQLQNQDPLNPQDGTEFVAQLSQFSSLEQQITTNSNLEKVVESSANFERQTALGLIGKSVAGKASSFKMAPDDEVDQEIVDALGFHPGELNGQLGYVLDGPADEVTLNVMDSDGKIVASFKEEGVDAGAHRLQWDGLDEDGKLLPAGNYSMKVTGKYLDEDGGDVEVEASPYLISTVIGVELDPSGNLLETAAGSVNQADVTTVLGY